MFLQQHVDAVAGSLRNRPKSKNVLEDDVVYLYHCFLQNKTQTYPLSLLQGKILLNKLKKNKN